jgi:hypothetical protein
MSTMTKSSAIAQQQQQQHHDRKNEIKSIETTTTTADKKKIQQSQKQKQHHHIEFSDFDLVFEIPHINDMTPEEIHDQWMTSEDLSNIRRGCIGTVRDINNGDPPEGTFLRGLDQHTLKYKERKEEIDRRVYDAVFRIQEFQRTSGVDATDVMANLCARYSEPSVVAAHTAAITDIFAAFHDTWSRRAIPDQAVFDDKPTSQNTYSY